MRSKKSYLPKGQGVVNRHKRAQEARTLTRSALEELKGKEAQPNADLW